MYSRYLINDNAPIHTHTNTHTHTHSFTNTCIHIITHSYTSTILDIRFRSCLYSLSKIKMQQTWASTVDILLIYLIYEFIKLKQGKKNDCCFLMILFFSFQIVTPQLHLFWFFPVLPQCDFCKAIILTKDGLDLRSEIFLLMTAVLIKCNRRRTVFSCTNEMGWALEHSESSRGNWTAESIGHKLWEEWNNLSGRLEVNYLVKI